MLLKLIGVEPRLRRIVNDLYGEIAKLKDEDARLRKIISGDVDVSTTIEDTLSAEVVNEAITEDDKYVLDGILTVVDSEGNVNEAFSGSVGISLTKTTTDGVVAVSGSAVTVAITKGVGTFSLEFTGEWDSAETVTVSISGSISGTSVTDSATITFEA